MERKIATVETRDELQALDASAVPRMTLGRVEVEAKLLACARRLQAGMRRAAFRSNLAEEAAAEVAREFEGQAPEGSVMMASRDCFVELQPLGTIDALKAASISSMDHYKKTLASKTILPWFQHVNQLGLFGSKWKGQYTIVQLENPRFALFALVMSNTVRTVGARYTFLGDRAAEVGTVTEGGWILDSMDGVGLTSHDSKNHAVFVVVAMDALKFGQLKREAEPAEPARAAAGAPAAPPQKRQARKRPQRPVDEQQEEEEGNRQFDPTAELVLLMMSKNKTFQTKILDYARVLAAEEDATLPPPPDMKDPPKIKRRCMSAPTAPTVAEDEEGPLAMPLGQDGGIVPQIHGDSILRANGGLSSAKGSPLRPQAVGRGPPGTPRNQHVAPNMSLLLSAGSIGAPAKQ